MTARVIWIVKILEDTTLVGARSSANAGSANAGKYLKKFQRAVYLFKLEINPVAWIDL